jgi:hypothetical protein
MGDGVDAGIHSSLIWENCKTSVLYQQAYQFIKSEDIAAGYGQLNPKPKPTVDPSVKQFAHMLKEHWNEYGISSVKPAMGIITLRVAGKKYEYELSDFKQLSEQAAVAGLI